MAKPEWGLKRVCQSCSAKFYDLQRSPIICPSCGATFDPDALLKSRRARPAAAKATPKEAAKKPVESVDDDALLDSDSDDDVETTEDDGDDAVLANTDDLGDDSDLADVVIESDKEDT